MAWSPAVVAAYRPLFGTPETVHTALPPLAAGGELADVAEFSLADGTVVYATAGVSEGGGWSAREFVLHAAASDARLVELLATIGGRSRHTTYDGGGTLPLSGPPDAPPIFDAVGFLYSGSSIAVEESRVNLQQLVGLTSEELEAARANSLYTVEAAWWKDGRGRLCEPGRPTSPSLAALVPVMPDVSLLPYEGREIAWSAITVDHDAAEGIRGQFGGDVAAVTAKVMAERLPHPSQLACLLHSLMDHAVEELKPVCLRLLQLSSDHAMAVQYYADALGMLAAIEGGDWEDAYFAYEGDFAAACVEAKRRRDAAGLDVEFGLIPNLPLGGRG